MAGDSRRRASVLAAAVVAAVAAIAPAAAQGAADQPNWKYFKNTPLLNGSDTDRRVIGCYPAGLVAASPCTVDERNTPAEATHPWDVPLPPASQVPTFTTSGPFADAALSALSPFAPDPARLVRPTDSTREYIYPWTDQWRNSNCNPANFSGPPPGAPGGTNANDVNAAILNVFVAHNHMHDWAKGLGFTPATFNMEDDDPALGNVQAGAKSGSGRTFSGRDAANYTTPADGTSPSFSSYLWQPIAGAYYPRCVDGSFDMSLLAHEYAHAIANRMVGGSSAGLSSSADGQALAIGEGFADSTAVAYLLDHGYAPADDEDPFSIGAYVSGDKAHGVRNYSMADSPLNYSNVQGWDGSGNSSPADDGEIWAAVNHDVRAALVAAHPADGNRRWMQIAFDALLAMPADATMIDARDAYIDAADQADEETLWTAFARRGLGSGASSTDTDDPDPEPSFESPLRTDESTITFAPGVEAELYVGDYEAGVTPVADTDPSTARDAAFELLPGHYSFLARADGRGAQRFERDIPAGSAVRLDVQLPVNRASAANGALATGDGARLGDLIDDTEATNWERTGADPAGAQVTVDLAGGAQVVERVNVSALLQGTDDGEEADDGDNQNRFTALRRFELHACSGACIGSASFTKIYTSPADAFPGAAPRPTTPDLNLRSFDVPDTVATHLRLVVASNQCTGSSLFTAESESDPSSASDCQAGNAGGVGRMDRAVRIAELQVFSRDIEPASGGSGPTTPIGPVAALPDPRPVLTRLSLSNRRFRRPKGTVIRFRLSEAARVTYTFRRRAGRRYVRAGTLKRAGRAGANRLRFYGRLSRRRALRPGVYRLVVVATDSAGQRSARKTASFTLLAR